MTQLPFSFEFSVFSRSPRAHRCSGSLFICL